jgi:hypothetical protein
MKPIAMKCTQSNWEEIKPILEKYKLNTKSVRYLNSDYYYLVNNSGGDLGEINNWNNFHKLEYNRTVFEEWNKEIFLEYCGIKEEFVLPKEWYCKPNDLNEAKILANYFDKEGCGISKNYSDDLDLVLKIGLSNCNYGYYESNTSKEITFEQFKKYVLKSEEKPKLFTIQDLSEGKCAVINDGTKKELNKVLDKAFPSDITSGGEMSFYMFNWDIFWKGTNETTLPTQSVKDFLKQMEKPKLTLDDAYIVECKNSEESTEVANFIKGLKVKWYYKYVINHKGLLHKIYTDFNIWNCIPEEVKHLPIITIRKMEKCLIKTIQKKI